MAHVSSVVYTVYVIKLNHSKLMCVGTVYLIQQFFMMSNEQFEQLMEIKQTRSEMQEKIGKLQKEVSANQDKTTQTIDSPKAEGDWGYIFCNKGHEQQFSLPWTLMSISRKHDRKLSR